MFSLKKNIVKTLNFLEISVFINFFPAYFSLSTYHSPPLNVLLTVHHWPTIHCTPLASHSPYTIGLPFTIHHWPTIHHTPLAYHSLYTIGLPLTIHHWSTIHCTPLTYHSPYTIGLYNGRPMVNGEW